MEDSANSLTVALTGYLPALLLLATVLTWPISVVLLWLHTRAVQRSMRSSSGAGPAPRAGAAPAVARVAGSQSVELHELGDASGGAAALPLLRALERRPWQAAAAYALAGLAYSAVNTVAFHMAVGLDVLPVRSLILLWTFAWPVVLTANMVAAATTRAKSVLTIGYFVVFALLSVLSSLLVGDASLLAQAAVWWGLNNGPATVLLLASLTRRVRAVGPLVLTFMLLALAGSSVVLAYVAARDARIRSVSDLAGALGLGPYGAMALMVAVGFLIFGVLGALALVWLTRRYRAKAISDESVTIDTIWMLFAFVHASGLVFEHPAWILVAPAAFLAFRISARRAIRWLNPGPQLARAAPRLLVLRSFAVGAKSERLFESLEKHWRRTGSIHLIAGVDLARRTVEPHEFVEFVTGRLARRFITDAATLERRVREMDTAPDRDLRFRVNDFFCQDDTWRMVLTRLLPESDAVLMDLRGFSRQNTGCLFELGELVRTDALKQVVFLIDDRTDEQLLRETLGAAAAASGDASGRQPTVGVVRSRTLRRDLRAVLRALAAATAVPEPVRA